MLLSSSSSHWRRLHVFNRLHPGKLQKCCFLQVHLIGEDYLIDCIRVNYKNVAFFKFISLEKIKIDCIRVNYKNVAFFKFISLEKIKIDCIRVNYKKVAFFKFISLEKII